VLEMLWRVSEGYDSAVDCNLLLSYFFLIKNEKNLSLQLEFIMSSGCLAFLSDANIAKNFVLLFVHWSGQHSRCHFQYFCQILDYLLPSGTKMCHVVDVICCI
jgi:hypothetical protein